MLTAAGKMIEIFTRIFVSSGARSCFEGQETDPAVARKNLLEACAMEKLSVLVWPLYSTRSTINLLEYLMQKWKARLHTTALIRRNFSFPYSQCSFRCIEFISLSNKILSSWCNKTWCPHTVKALDPQNHSLAEWMRFPSNKISISVVDPYPFPHKLQWG